MNAELQVRKTVQEHNMIEAGDTVILGLSGGPDSLCLLHVLKSMQRSLPFTLQALHVNHMMRGERAKEDEQWLSDHCRQLGVPLMVTLCDVYGKAEAEGISPEEAGRKARHSALQRQKAMLESPCGSLCKGSRVRIALAHNRDDQAETVLMRMLRGTGIHGLAPRWDSTNADTYYTRNKLRLKVLPLLEKEFNPNLKETLARLAASAREDDALLEKLARQAAEGHRGSFPVKELAAMDGALAKRVVRILFAQEGLTEDIASAHLESLLEAARGRRTGKVIEFPHGYRAEITHEEVRFCL